MSGKSKVLSNSLLYTVSNLLLKGANFILLPIYTYSMSSADFGTINLINAFKYLMAYLIGFSLYSAVTRFYADLTNNRKKLKEYNGTLIIFILISSIMFFVISILMKNYIATTFFEGIPYYPIIFMTMLFLIFHCQHTLHQSILQSLELGKKLTLINILFLIFQTILTVCLVGVLKLGAAGYVLTLLIANFSYFIYMLIDLYRNDLLSFKFDYKSLRASLKYSLPLLPHDLSGQIATFISRILINKSGSLASVGLYGVASQFGVLVDSFQFSVNKAFAPWFFNYMTKSKYYSNNDALQLSSLLLYIYSFVYLITGLFSQEVIIILTPDSYTLAWKIIPIIITGYAIKSIYYFLLNILMYIKSASSKIFYATLTGSLIEVLLASTWIPQYGMYGAAFSFTVSKIIMVVIMVYITNKYNNIYKVKNMLGIIFPGIIAMMVGLVFSYAKYQMKFNIYNFIYKLIVLVFYVIYVFYSNKEEVKKYKEILFKKSQLKFGLRNKL